MPLLRLPELSTSYTWIEDARAPARRDTIVLVHGLAASLGFWYLSVAPALARTYRVLLFDLRGHGRSSTPSSGYTPANLARDMRELLDRLEVDRAHLVGHSFGGAVALRFAAQYPHRVSSLTLADVRLRSFQPRLELGSWSTWARYRSVLAGFGIDMDDTADELGPEFFEKLAKLRLAHPAQMERLTRVLPTPFGGLRGDVAAERWLALLATTTARSDLTVSEGVSSSDIASLDISLLLVYGEYSHSLPTALGLKAAARRAHLEIVPRAGHFFPLTKPEALVAPITALIGTSPERLLTA